MVCDTRAGVVHPYIMYRLVRYVQKVVQIVLHGIAALS